MSCHFQLPRIYSPDERMWEEECFNRAVKHWRVIMNYTAKGGWVLYGYTPSLEGVFVLLISEWVFPVKLILKVCEVVGNISREALYK